MEQCVIYNGAILGSADYAKVNVNFLGMYIYMGVKVGRDTRARPLLYIFL